MEKPSFYSKWFSKGEIYFAACFIAIFFISFVSLYLIGLIPTEFQSEPSGGTLAIQNLEDGSKDAFGLNGSNTQTVQASSATQAEQPISIEIPSVGTNINIVNPNTTNTDVLDEDLAKGVVHYPGSGNPGQGNMFIFGHSTSFKVVNNKAYQAFNNLSKLNVGDQILIKTASKTYIYRVRTVKLENENEALVNFSTKQNMLTLSTCNSFGAKTDRYVVQADFVSTANI